MQLVRQRFWMVHAIVVTSCAVLAGRAAAHLVTGAYLAGVPPLRAHAAARQGAPALERRREAIVARDIFCSGCTRAEEKPGGASDEKSDKMPHRTALPIELVTTLIAPADDEWSIAILRDLSSPQNDPIACGHGHRIAGAIVERVLPRHVLLRNQGRLEYVDFDGAPATATPAPAAGPPAPAPARDVGNDVRCGGASCTVARTLVNKLLGDLTALASSVRVLPIQTARGPGLRLDAIRPGTLFAALQLRNGDVLQAVNGTALTTPDVGLSLYTRLKTASHVSLKVDRAGATVTLDYTIQ